MGFRDTLQAVWNLLTGEEDRRRQQAERETANAQAPTEADRKLLAEQEKVRLAAEAEKQRMAERLSPADRLLERDLSRPAPKHEPVPEPLQDGREVEATRVELTRNVQPAPSQPGPGKTFANSRAVQRGQPVQEAPKPVREGQAQPSNSAQPVRENEELQAALEVKRAVPRGTVEEKIQRTLKAREEAEAVLKALQEGRVGRIERENERGGRRMT